jgi:hypothetical protein
VLLINLVIYIAIFVHLRLYSRRSEVVLGRTTTQDALKKLASRLLLYPLFYAMLILPITSIRLHMMAGGHATLAAVAAGGTILAFAGVVNVMLYGFTRKVVSLDYIPPLRRPSWSRKLSGQSQ